jgi:hypothetical protein
LCIVDFVGDDVAHLITITWQTVTDEACGESCTVDDDAGRVPVVEVQRIDTSDPDPAYWMQVIVCPYCGREHAHGLGTGHRVAHCLGDNAGYIIAPIPGRG